MAEKTVAVTPQSAASIKQALEELANSPAPRQITGLEIRNGDLIIKHVPKT